MRDEPSTDRSSFTRGVCPVKKKATPTRPPLQNTQGLSRVGDPEKPTDQEIYATGFGVA
jgi:hypothetical protein